MFDLYQNSLTYSITPFPCPFRAYLGIFDC